MLGVIPVSLSSGILHSNFLDASQFLTLQHQCWRHPCLSNGASNAHIQPLTTRLRSPIPCLEMFCQGWHASVNFVDTIYLQHQSVQFLPTSVLALSVLMPLGMPIFLPKFWRATNEWDSVFIGLTYMYSVLRPRNN